MSDRPTRELTPAEVAKVQEALDAANVLTVSLSDLMKDKPEAILEDLIKELREMGSDGSGAAGLLLRRRDFFYALDRAEARLRDWNRE